MTLNYEVPWSCSSIRDGIGSIRGHLNVLVDTVSYSEQTVP